MVQKELNEKSREEYRAKICLQMICEFLRQRPDNSMGKTNMSVKDYSLEQFQRWIGKKIMSPNESEEYVKYRKKYYHQKKYQQRKKQQASNLSKE